MTPEQLESLYGPLWKHADHKIGDVVRFYDVVLNQEMEGTIEWVQAPGANYEGGTSQPVSYVLNIVDPSTGFPYCVFPSDIIESVQ